MVRVVLSLLASVLAIIVAAKLVFNVTAYTGAGPANEPWAQNKMEFVAWNDEKWTAWIRGDAFELVPQDTVKWTRHANASMAFIDWEGQEWQAKIDGDIYLLAVRGDWEGTTERATAIQYRDWRGENQMRTVAQLKR